MLWELLRCSLTFLVSVSRCGTEEQIELYPGIKMPEFNSQVARNVTLFGDQVLTEVIKWKRGPGVLGLIEYDLCLYKKRKRNTKPYGERGV